ncbi:hypothetical protein QU481_03595 [Crenobacter sp. SG2303]|uniref:Uncharacterized protein n=1 Tax=Crenobacter oryzisoli TaxID=3056844 RepID=A0ABT7XJM5_9NEIS|nr:hypothetical protein [Crenobacter sp. SG2303]MDN0073977.1 hypothetical protein [Crenobacter sp. SG2303]
MTEFHSSLPDPRQYTPVAPKNELIRLTLAVQDAANSDDRALWHSELATALTGYLERNELLPLSVALAMLPSQEAYRTLWQALREVVECNPNGPTALPFALPLVLVAGSRQKTTLAGELSNIDEINALLREHGVFAAGCDASLGAKLIHPDTLAGINSSRLYYLAQDGAGLARTLDQLPAAPVELNGEGVFLRYLVGQVTVAEGAEPPVRFGSAVNSWGLPVMKLLNAALDQDGVTLFPIARAPQPVMQAMVAGGMARQDVALEVFASAQIRALRELGKEPVAIASAHENGELRFTVSTPGDERNWKGFVWPLSPLDSVERIVANFRELMADCQVNDVRLLPEVAADKEGDIPLFFTADDLPPVDAVRQ